MSVKRGAYCNNDHHLVCTRLKFGRYLETVLERASASYMEDGVVLEEKWLAEMESNST